MTSGFLGVLITFESIFCSYYQSSSIFLRSKDSRKELNFCTKAQKSNNVLLGEEQVESRDTRSVREDNQTYIMSALATTLLIFTLLISTGKLC